MDKNYRRICYAGYAYDFLITIKGTKTEALDIKQKCTASLNQLKLTLSDEKTLNPNPKDRPLSFLGYVIQNAPFCICIQNEMKFFLLPLFHMYLGYLYRLHLYSYCSFLLLLAVSQGLGPLTNEASKWQFTSKGEEGVGLSLVTSEGSA